MIEFWVPAGVEPKQSDRNRIVESHGRRFITHYQPAKIRRNAATIAALAAQHRPARPLEGPVFLDLIFCRPWRKGDGQRVRAAGAAYQSVKPDWDNLCKQVCDVLQQVGFFTNDAQIADVCVTKIFTDQVGVLVRVGEADTKNLPEIVASVKKAAEVAR